MLRVHRVLGNPQMIKEGLDGWRSQQIFFYLLFISLSW
jgi:hypothetical protein